MLPFCRGGWESLEAPVVTAISRYAAERVALEPTITSGFRPERIKNIDL